MNIRLPTTAVLPVLLVLVGCASKPDPRRYRGGPYPAVVAAVSPTAVVNLARAEEPTVLLPLENGKHLRVQKGLVILAPVVDGVHTRWFGPVFKARINGPDFIISDTEGSVAFDLNRVHRINIAPVPLGGGGRSVRVNPVTATFTGVGCLSAIRDAWPR